MYISIIVSTYNRPDALALVLQALAQQNYQGKFEVLIADDGSEDKTKALIEDFAKHAPFPLRHIWQKNTGFRAGMIRNKAVAEAQGDHLIFLDGDCVPLNSFVHYHAKLAEDGYFVAGNRALLNQEFTSLVLENSLPIYVWTKMRWLNARLHGFCNKFFGLFYLPLGFLRKSKPCKWRGAKSCNLAIWRKDFLAVNGFDELYSGWGHEDSDLVIRLINVGVLRKDGRFATTVLHLWHEHYDRSCAQDNWQRLEARLKSGIVKAELGVDQYLIKK